MKIAQDSVKRAFLSGMFALIPLTITAWLTYYIIKRIYVTFQFMRGVLPEEYRNLFISKVAVFVGSTVIFFFLIVLIGYLVKTIVGRAVRKSIEHFLMTIPVVSSVYSLFKDFLELIQRYQNKNEFKQVVFVEYPHRDKWVVAFLTGECSPRFSPDERKYYTVFMPSTPNPTTGFLFIVPEEDIRFTDLSIEETFKLILSGGFIKGDSMQGPDSLDEN